jgi:hypothetical protein
MVSEIIEIHVFFMSYRDTILNGKININFTAGNYFRFAILCRELDFVLRRDNREVNGSHAR